MQPQLIYFEGLNLKYTKALSLQHYIPFSHNRCVIAATRRVSLVAPTRILGEIQKIVVSDSGEARSDSPLAKLLMLGSGLHLDAAIVRRRRVGAGLGLSGGRIMIAEVTFPGMRSRGRGMDRDLVFEVCRTFLTGLDEAGADDNTGLESTFACCICVTFLRSTRPMSSGSYVCRLLKAVETNQ